MRHRLQSNFLGRTRARTVASAWILLQMALYCARRSIDLESPSIGRTKLPLMDANYCHGLLVVDKPGGITSREVVNRAQAWFPRRTRLGHAGTLDPLATGVLVICVG